MKSWIKQCGGVMFASLLTFILSGKAYAAVETSDAEIPAEVFGSAAASDGLTASVSETPSAEGSPINASSETGVVSSSDSSVPGNDSEAESNQDEVAFSASSADLSDFSPSGASDTADDHNDIAVSDSSSTTDDLSVPSDASDTDDSSVASDASGTDGAVTLADSLLNNDSEELPADDVMDVSLSLSKDDTILTDENDVPEENSLPETVEPAAAQGVRLGAFRSAAPGRMTLTSGNDEGESDTDDDETDPVQADAILVIGKETVDLENGSEDEGGQWRYDAEYDSVVLKNYDGSGQLIGTANKDLTISATGVNRIGTLVVDGDLNIIGSGILLIDSIEMAEGTNFELKTNTNIYPDKTGSAAVFLKQQDGTYLLINGDPNDTDNPGIAAILDGDCTVPDGVTLVLPDHTQMILQSVSDLKDQNGNYQYSTTEILGADDTDLWSPDIKATAPKLTIPKSSNLVVCSGAVLEFHPIAGEQYVTDKGNSISLEKRKKNVTYAPSIVVNGGLELNCDDMSNAVLVFGQDSSFSGSATITRSTVRIAEDITDPFSAMNVKNSTVILEGDNADLESIHIAGTDNVLIFKGDCEIGSISMESGSKLTCRDSGRFGGNKTLTVSGSLEAETVTVTMPSTPMPGIDLGDHTFLIHGQATVVLQSGIYQMYDTDPNVTITSSWDLNEITASIYHIETPITGAAALFDYTVGARTPGGCPLVESGLQQGSLIDPMIPVYCGYVYSLKTDDDSVISVFKDAPEEKQIIRINGASISKDILNDKLDYYSLAIVETVDENGHYDLVTLDDYNNKSIPMNTIKRIYLCDIDDGSHAQGGGSVATSTHTNYTGTGILGGQGAGSVQGGSGSTVFSGSGISNPIKPGDNGNGDNGNGNGDNGNGNGDNGNGNGDNGNGNGDNGNGNGDNGNGNGDNGNGVDPSDDNGSGKENEGNKDSKNVGSVSDGEQSEAFWVEEDQKGYVLCAKDGVDTLKDLGGHVKIRMPYTPPAGMNGKSVYAVFRTGDGTLRAFKASISILKGELSFTSECLGRFIIVSFEFDGEEFSDAFYEALEKLVGGLI